jgi:hypothetical protein
MTLVSISWVVVAAGLCLALEHQPAAAQTPPATSATMPQAGSILLTIFLRHDQSKTVDEINEHLRKTGWYDKFPPEGVEIVA